MLNGPIGSKKNTKPGSKVLLTSSSPKNTVPLTQKWGIHCIYSLRLLSRKSNYRDIRLGLILSLNREYQEDEIFSPRMAMVSFYFSSLSTIPLAQKPNQPIAFNHKKHTNRGWDVTPVTSTIRPRLSPECLTSPSVSSAQRSGDPESGRGEDQAVCKKGGSNPLEANLPRARSCLLFSSSSCRSRKDQCQTCHGGIAQSEKPPARPFLRMTMGWCMSCHAKNKVTNDCLACHV